MPINKVVYGSNVLIDISDTTAVASDVAAGKYFYALDGTKTLGTASGGGSVTVTDEVNATGITCVIESDGSSPEIQYDVIWDYTDGLLSENDFIKYINGDNASETLLNDGVELSADDSSSYIRMRALTETCTSGIAEFVFSGTKYSSSTAAGARFILSNGTSGLQIFIQGAGVVKYQRGSNLADTGARCGDGQDHVLKFEFNDGGTNRVYFDGVRIVETDVVSSQYVSANSIFAQSNTTIKLKSVKYAFDYFS